MDDVVTEEQLYDDVHTASAMIHTVMMKTIAQVNFITRTNNLGLRVHGQLFQPALSPT
jgi:hypothetical protein